MFKYWQVSHKQLDWTGFSFIFDEFFSVYTLEIELQIQDAIIRINNSLCHSQTYILTRHVQGFFLFLRKSIFVRQTCDILRSLNTICLLGIANLSHSNSSHDQTELLSCNMHKHSLSVSLYDLQVHVTNTILITWFT